MFQVPSSNDGLRFHSNLFTDNQWQEAVFEKRIKSWDKKLCKKLTTEKWNLIADHRGNAVSNFFESIFIVKRQVLLLFSGINVPLPKVIFSQVFEKANCNAFKNVM